MGLWEIEAEDLKKWYVFSSCQESFLADIRLVCLPISKKLPVGAIWGLVVTTSDKVYAVGDIPAWALYRETEGVSEPLEIAELSGRGVVGFACGIEHCLALTGSGAVFTWGFNSYGQLGLGSSENSRVPVQVPDLQQVTSIACGFRFSLALTKDEVYEWGLIFQSASTLLSPKRVEFPAGVTPISIACGVFHAAAMGSDGKVYCWSRNFSGQLGNSSEVLVGNTMPEPVELASAVSQVCCLKYSTVALTVEGQVWAWGNNMGGSLGLGLSDDSICYPMLVKGLQSVTDITSVWYMKNFLARTDSTIFLCGETFASDDMASKPKADSSLAEALANRKTPSLSVRGRSGGPPAHQHTQTIQQQVEVVKQVTQQQTQAALELTKASQQQTQAVLELTKASQQHRQAALEKTKVSQQQTQATLELNKVSQQQLEATLQLGETVKQVYQQLTRAVDLLSQNLN